MDPENIEGLSKVHGQEFVFQFFKIDFFRMGSMGDSETSLDQF